MKRIKWTPVLLLFPISIIIFIIDMRSEAWTPFSLFFIIGFIFMPEAEVEVEAAVRE